MKIITTFPKTSEYEKIKRLLDEKALPYDVIIPSKCYERVGHPAVILEKEVRSELASLSDYDFICSGWVDYYPPSIDMPDHSTRDFNDDVFGNASIMVLAPCIADPQKIRLVAHISGNMEEAFPFLNSDMREGCYNRDGKTFSFIDGYRMISLYPQRVSIAKADDIVDGWRMLEKIRCRVNEVYSRRASIEPSYEMRKKPPALEIYKRLPGTNCRMCGQKTCMAFALTLWSGNAKPDQCTPIFKGEYTHLKDAFLEICAGIGLSDFHIE